MFALAREQLVPSFLRRQESRRSVGVKGAPNVRRRPIMRGALGALVGRRADGRSSHRWAVAWIPASAGMTDRAPTAPTELIFNTVALSLRDISPRSARGEPKPAPAQAGGRGGLARQPRATEGPPYMFALAREVLVPSFLRRQESRRSVGVKGAPNVRRRPIMRGALGALVGRRADGRSSHRWAVAWIPASAGMTDRAPTAPTELIFNTVALSLRDISPRSARGEPKPAPAQAGGRGGLARQPRATEGPPCMFALAREVLVPSFLRRQESRRSVGVKGAPNVRRRPIMRGALGALVGRRADGRSSHRWAAAWIPASAGMTDRAPTAPTELIFNTVALSLRDLSPAAYANGPAEAGPFDRPPGPKP